MRAMRKTSRGIRPLLAVAASLLCLTACNRNKQKAVVVPTAQLDLKPAAAARADLAASIVLPSFDRTLANVGAVAKKLGLPFGEADLKRMLTARGGIVPTIFERLDLSKPAAAAVVLARKKGATAESTEPALAFE